MIGLNYLGKMGQLGNQMFQYAALKGIARNRGLDFIIPNHSEAIQGQSWQHFYVLNYLNHSISKSNNYGLYRN